MTQWPPIAVVVVTEAINAITVWIRSRRHGTLGGSSLQGGSGGGGGKVCDISCIPADAVPDDVKSVTSKKLVAHCPAAAAAIIIVVVLAAAVT